MQYLWYHSLKIVRTTTLELTARKNATQPARGVQRQQVSVKMDVSQDGQGAIVI